MDDVDDWSRELDDTDLESNAIIEPSPNWSYDSKENALVLKKGLDLHRDSHNVQVFSPAVVSELTKKAIALEMDQQFSIPKIVNEFLDVIPIYYDKNKIFWVWDLEKCIYIMMDETDILVLLSNTYSITGLHKSKLQTEFLNALKIESRRRKPKDPLPEWIQFGTMIYDLKTNEEFNADAKTFFTNTLPFLPSKNSNTPMLDKLFTEWVGIENVDLLYQIIAYCCYRDYPIHHLFCFIGSGSNGKSTFLDIVTKFVSRDNCTSVSLDKLMSNNFASSNLYKKLVCQMGETNFNTMSRTELLKKLTGNDMIDFEFKNKNPFIDKSYAKILISTNTLPETTDDTDGFHRRWVNIDFPNRFTGDMNILEYIPENEFNNLSRKVIEILPKLLYERKFYNIGSIDDRRKKYKDKSNPLPKFLSEYTTDDVNGTIPKWEFKQRFNDYLIQNNLRQRTDTEIGSRMKELYEEHKSAYNTDEGTKYVRSWIGLSWKSDNIKVSKDNDIFEDIKNSKRLDINGNEL